MASAIPATAVLVDRESLERGISSNRHALSKTKTELVRSAGDKKNFERLKNKLALLENDTRLKEQRLELYLLKAGDWMRLPEGLRKRYMRQAGVPDDAMDDLTLYVMGHPTDLNKPLENILLNQGLRNRRSAKK